VDRIGTGMTFNTIQQGMKLQDNQFICATDSAFTNLLPNDDSV
jgi:hypothetical protein